MIEGSLKYIAGQDGHINEVILPIAIFKKMVEELKDKELLRMMKKAEKRWGDYVSEDESYDMPESREKHQKSSWLGCLSDKTQIHGDIISPVIDENQ